MNPTNAKPDPTPERDKRRPLRSQLKRLRAAVGVAPPQAPPAPPEEKLPPRSAEQRDRVVARRGPLPVGSQLILSCVGTRRWEGVLTVPDEPTRGFKVFTHEADGAFRVAQELDDLYRAWLAQKDGGE